MSKTIELRIYPDGLVDAKVLGFRGKKCADYISILEKLLDAEAIDSEALPEYYLIDEDVREEDQVGVTDSVSQTEIRQGDQ